MKEPLLPADSFALKSYLELLSVLRDLMMLSGVIPSIFLMALKMAGAHSMTCTSSLMVIVFRSSSDASRCRALLASWISDFTYWDILRRVFPAVEDLSWPPVVYEVISSSAFEVAAAVAASAF